MRKTVKIPLEIDTRINEFLKGVEAQQGFRITKQSWVIQAIREKMDKDTKLMVP
jgi:hypothetical protein